MKILFIIPRESNVYGGKKTRPRLPHLGIAYLSAYLKRYGHEVSLYDCTVEDNDDLLFNELLSSCDLVGLSLYSYKISPSYAFINRIIDHLRRSTDKNIPVVLGGPHITVTGKEALIKIAIQREGELTLSELLKSLQSGDSFEHIDGLIWRNKAGRIVENVERGFIDDVDALPFPDYSIFKLDKYISYELNEMPLSTSRGCPFECVFCAAKIIAGKRFRARSPHNVIQEITLHYKNGIRNFYISDDAFNLDINRAEEICDLIIKNNFKIKFVLQNGIRLDCLTYKLAEKLKKAGCATIVLPAESGNNDVLKAIKKNITVEKINSAVKILSDVNINFIVNFIIGHPTETYYKAMQSIELAREIIKKKNCITIMFFNLIVYPSTAVFEWVDKNGKWLFPKEKYLDNVMTGDMPIFETSEFTKEQRIGCLKEGEKIHRAALLRFIFGKYIGFIVYYITDIKFIKYIAVRFSFNNKFGEEIIYRRFLRKIYGIKT